MSLLLNKLTQQDSIKKDDVFYQILVISPLDKNIPEKPMNAKKKHINAKIEVNKKSYFEKYLLDKDTQDKLEEYHPDQINNIGSCLPSPGVTFLKGFYETLFKDCPEESKPLKINNFYEPIKTLLQTRKISQLIAKTWSAYLTAKDEELWEKFTDGQWNDIPDDILDGLIAREIFFFNRGHSPDEIGKNSAEIYRPLFTNNENNENPKTLFLIPPSSKAWQGISLSLLMAGQAYRKVGDGEQAKYHQISQPILSTGDIVFRYELEVDWNHFEGGIQEMQLAPGKVSVASKATVPYPPIPSSSNLSPYQIKQWAEATDEGGDFPFYTKEPVDKQGDKYSLNVQYFCPPYQYLPLSTC